MITREIFVKICTDAILKTRSELAIGNQLSGYKKYHKEMKDNKYFINCRAIMEKNESRYGYSLSDQYYLIQQSGMGNCREIAEFLSVEIIESLKTYNTDARIRLVISEKMDHVFLQIRIFLKGEKDSSLWEVDGWDPRVIDISMRPDGTIKNQEALIYGTNPDLVYSISTNEYKFERKPDAFFQMKKPVEGAPKRDATPEREMFRKYNHLYKDYTLDNAYRNKKLDKEGEIHYLQRKSSWQS